MPFRVLDDASDAPLRRHRRRHEQQEHHGPGAQHSKSIIHAVTTTGFRRILGGLVSAALFVTLTTAWAAAQKGSSASPRLQDGIDLSRLDEIPPLVEEAIADKKLPGAVVLIGRGDHVVYEKAIGRRAVQPSPEAMTLDTIFDVASLTKVVATTTSVMKLVEEGRIRLSDRVSTFVPGFERHDKTDITIRHLMTHTSGLRPDVDLADPWSGYDKAIEIAIEEVPTARPGERFVYSDINYVLLGDVVKRVSGMPLDQFAKEHIFEPLGMKDTGFLPAASLRPRIAPTEKCTPLGWPCEGPDADWLRGI